MVTVAEFRLIHSTFLAILEQQFDRPVPIPDSVQKLLEAEESSAEDQPLSEEPVAWLDLISAAISPYRLRRYGQEDGIAEPACQALLRFWASRRSRSTEELDKVDWLTTHFFRAREEKNKQPVGWAKDELQDLLKGIPFPPLGLDAQGFLEGFPALLEDAGYFATFTQIPESHVLERGRELKVQMGNDFCHPAVLATVVNYNLVLGKRFEELADRALLQARKTAPATTIYQLTEALRNDYRFNGPVIQQLADLSRKELLKKGEAQIGPRLDPLLDGQLERLGVDRNHELSKLQSRIRELAKKMIEDSAVRSIRICGRPLSLSEWEVDALRSLIGKREENLQGAFARIVSRAIAFVVRIYEELHAYETKKGAGDAEWRKHHNVLFYLLYEGQELRTCLLQLSLVHRKSGHPELAQQLVSTAEKLGAKLGRLDELF